MDNEKNELEKNELEKKEIVEKAIQELEESEYLAWDKACRVYYVY